MLLRGVHPHSSMEAFTNDICVYIVTFDPGKMVAPMPIRQPSSTVQPESVAPCPIVTWLPTVVGNLFGNWVIIPPIVHPSCTFEPAPITTGPLSPNKHV